MVVLSSNYVMTRKEQRCFGCSRVMPTKTTMLVSVTADGGSITRGYWCRECLDMVAGDTEYTEGHFAGCHEATNEPI